MLKNKLLSAMGGAPANYIEDVFSTWLYTGNGSTQTITNGIDLAGNGGLVWMKNRTNVQLHSLCDTVTGAGKYLNSASTAAQSSGSTFLQSFTSTGFSIGSTFNATGDAYASWTFREQPKFFDVVTFTGNGSVGQTIAHNLQSGYGFIAIKRTDAVSDWFVLARDSSGSYWQLKLNSTAANTGLFSADPNISTVFYPSSVIGAAAVNGATYVAYLFAHNAGGFGLTGTDNVISCGSYTGVAGTQTVNVGFEPQWLLIKKTNGAADWKIVDNMRGFTAGPESTGIYSNALVPNTSGAEAANSTLYTTSTGFTVNNYSSEGGAGNTFIYIAIRRGPMKTPTTGTQVYQPATVVNSSDNFFADANESLYRDLIMTNLTDGSIGEHRVYSKLIGYGASGESKNYLVTSSTAAQSTDTSNSNNVYRHISTNSLNGYLRLTTSGRYGVLHRLRRAPGFFDVVCWSGDGTGNPRNHNLSVAPELVISKPRSSTGNWDVEYANSPRVSGNLNLATALSSKGGPVNTTTQFYPINDSSVITYVTYLFATCPGVSKVGSYTGNGSNQTIDCGFTGGARFVLVKRSSASGDWRLFDSARGIVSGNDPFMTLNTTDPEITSYDTLDTASGGFVVNQDDVNLNVNAATYIYLAIA